MDKMIRLDDHADLAVEKLQHEVLLKTGKKIFKKKIVNWIILNVFTCRDNQCEHEFWEWVKSL
jgi:hypothetical protein